MKPNLRVVSPYIPEHGSSRSLGVDNTTTNKYPLSRRDFLAAAAGAAATLAVPKAVSGIARLLGGDEQSPEPPKTRAYEFLDLFQRHKAIYGFSGIFGFFPQYTVSTENWPFFYPTRYEGTVNSGITQPIGLDLRNAQTITIGTYVASDSPHYRLSSSVEVDVMTGEPVRILSAPFGNIPFKDLESHQQEQVRSQVGDALVKLIQKIRDDASRLAGRENRTG